MAENKNTPTIIIKKEEVVEGGHHGGAWKVAYADFMTAMMSFFLLMWLLNVTTDEQKRGIALFFNPMADRTGTASSDQSMLESSPLTSPSSVQEVQDAKYEPSPQDHGHDDHKADAAKQVVSGGSQGAQSGAQAQDGILSNTGTSFLSQGAQTSIGEHDAAITSHAMAVIPLGGPQTGAARAIGQVGEGNAATVGGDDNLEGGNNGGNGEAGAYHRAIAEEKQLQKTIAGLKESLQKGGQFGALEGNVGFKIGSDEIRIEMQDTAHQPMFDTGTVAPNKAGQALLTEIGKWLASLPETISIIGETDGMPYRVQQAHQHSLSNWTLSEMRADRAREVLVQAGYPDRRIESVVGRADRNLAVPDRPEAPENRRVVLIIHRRHPLPQSFQSAGGHLQPQNGGAP